jgi:hypothetical protein
VTQSEQLAESVVIFEPYHQPSRRRRHNTAVLIDLGQLINYQWGYQHRGQMLEPEPRERRLER